MKTYAVLFVLAFLASFVGTPLLQRLVARWGLLDSAFKAGPHQRRPIPRLGGVIIYLALLGTLLALFFPSNVITQEFRHQLPTLWLLWGPATFILLVGVADDIWGMKAWVKFGAQLGAAFWLVSAGVQISHLSLPWDHTVELGWWAPLITLAWLVGVMNAFNLIDGLDGLAAGVAFLAASAIAVTAVMINDTMVVVITVALAGALLGFLRHNFNPATIFLGDSGSLFVGFVLAAAAVVWHQKATTAIAVAAPLLAFGLPVAETVLTVMRRYLRGQHLFAADRKHIHHTLLELGLTSRQATMLLYATAAAGALGCVLIARGHNMVTAAVIFSFLGVFAVIGYWIYPEFSEVGRGVSRNRLLARVRAIEAIELLRLARTRPEFCQRLQVAARVLEVDWVELRAASHGPLDCADAGNGGGRRDSSTMVRMTVPLPSGGSLLLGRSPWRAHTEWSMEVVARQLSGVVEETLRGWKVSAALAAALAPGPESAGER
ncbi:MAG: MraY family glycosyltransferase [Terriglobia bacterium]